VPAQRFFLRPRTYVAWAAIAAVVQAAMLPFDPWLYVIVFLVVTGLSALVLLTALVSLFFAETGRRRGLVGAAAVLVAETTAAFMVMGTFHWGC
jgi:hypothetical protein